MEKYNGLIIGVALIVSSVIIYFALSQIRYHATSHIASDGVNVVLVDRKKGIASGCFLALDNPYTDRCKIRIKEASGTIEDNGE